MEGRSGRHSDIRTAGRHRRRHSSSDQASRRTTRTMTRCRRLPLRLRTARSATRGRRTSGDNHFDRMLASFLTASKLNTDIGTSVTTTAPMSTEGSNRDRRLSDTTIASDDADMGTSDAFDRGGMSAASGPIAAPAHGIRPDFT